MLPLHVSDSGLYVGHRTATLRQPYVVTLTYGTCSRRCTSSYQVLAYSPSEARAVALSHAALTFRLMGKTTPPKPTRIVVERGEKVKALADA